MFVSDRGKGGHLMGETEAPWRVYVHGAQAVERLLVFASIFILVIFKSVSILICESVYYLLAGFYVVHGL